MLIIRSAQLNQLELQQWEVVEREIAGTLRRDFPVSVSEYEDSALLSLVRRAIQIARNYGLQRWVDLLSFAVLTVSYGDDFHLRPELAWILSDPKFPGDRKMQFLLSETLPEQWQRIVGARAKAE